MRLPDNGRAAHPKLRATSHRHWTLDEIVGGSHLSLEPSQGELTVTKSGGTLPPPIPGPTGRALAFDGISHFVGQVGDAASRTALEGNWTMGALVRLRSHGVTISPPTAFPPARSAIFGYSGPVGTASAGDNTMASMQIENNRHPRFAWEYGVGNALSVEADNVLIPIDEWMLMFWRKSNTVGGGGPGDTCDLDLFINGQLAQGANHPTDPDGGFTGVRNTSDGADAEWAAGGLFFAGEAISNPLDGDIGGLYFCSSALSDGEMAADQRRLELEGFFTRADVRVEIEDGNGARRTLTDFEGTDFVNEASWTDDNSAPTRDATVTLLREQGNLSLSPLVTTSKVNLLDINDPDSYVDGQLLEAQRQLEIFSATVPLDTVANDLESVFLGYIDTIKPTDGMVKLSCRDEGARLLDAHIQSFYNYGGDPVDGTPPLTAVDVLAELQDILDDNDNDGTNGPQTPLAEARIEGYDPVTLRVPFDPELDSLGWAQSRTKVLTALRTISAIAAFDIRYQYDQDPEAPGWKLTMFEPQRDQGYVDGVVDPLDILDITDLSIDLLNNRNAFRLIYNSGARQPTPIADATVQAALDAIAPGVFDLEENIHNAVDSEGEPLGAAITVRHIASAARYKRLFAESLEASSSQVDLYTIAVRMAAGYLLDVAEPDLNKSVLLPLRWNRSVNDFLYFLPVKGMFTTAHRLALVSTTNTVGATATTTAKLRGHPAMGPGRWHQLEAGPGAGAAPTVDLANPLTDLTNSQLLTVATNISVRTGYGQGGSKYPQVFNGDFRSFSRSFLYFPPDGWEMDTSGPGAGVWGTDVEAEASIQKSGGSSLKFNTDAIIKSGLIPVDGVTDIPLMLEFTARKDVAADRRLQLTLREFRADRTLLTTLPAFQPALKAAPGQWESRRTLGFFLDTTLARYVQVVIQGDPNDIVYCDKVALYVPSIEARAELLADQAYVAASGTWVDVELDDDASGSAAGTGPRDYGTNFNTVTSTFTAPEEGIYDIEGGVHANGATILDMDDANVKLVYGISGDETRGPGTSFREVRFATYHAYPKVAETKAMAAGETVKLQAVVRGAIVTVAFKADKETFLNVKLRSAE